VTRHEVLPCGCEVTVRRGADAIHDYAGVRHCAAGRECGNWEQALDRLKGEADAGRSADGS
jgi:hypothetical protein